MQHVNLSFNIQAPEINFSTAQLFVEVGPTGFLLSILDEANCFKAVVIYTIDLGLPQQEISEKLRTILITEVLLQKQYLKSHIFWSFTESILVPAELSNNDRNINMLNLVFGDGNTGINKTDFLINQNLQNTYRIPRDIFEIFYTHLPSATQTHINTKLVSRDFSNDNHLYTIFYNNSINILLCKEGVLQICQNFLYYNLDQAAFNLLNVCKGFDVDPNTVTLHVNGMIDAQSGLYEAIYKYFLNIKFDTLPKEFTYYKAIEDLPPHFFSHLFSLATCA